MKFNVKVVLSWFLVFVVMFMIFGFSGEPGEKSEETSKGFIVEVLDIVMEKEEITPQVVKKFQFPVRKMAHFGEYMLLGFCLINALKETTNKKVLFNGLFSVAIALLYAITDELHQSFIGNRGPKYVDVLIDFSGSVIGVLIFIGFIYWYNKLIKRSRTV